MRRSRLLDRGREVMWIYPQVEVIDSRGMRNLVASPDPVKIYVTTKEGRSSDAELPGNVSAKVVEVFTRSAPVGSWAKVYYAGEYWDVAAPPRFIAGMSKATAGVMFSIRSRNKAGE